MGINVFSESNFTEALLDYYYLINRNYPEKGTLKLVGDRYRLTGKHRTILYRGISSSQKNSLRINRLTNQMEQQDLIIDAYNVILTILNYKLGRPVFISSDGLCRDAGSLFGKIRKREVFLETLMQLVKFLKTRNLRFAKVYFDSPVSFSREHAYEAQQCFDNAQIPAKVEIVKSADKSLIDALSGILCTSDTGIIDQTELALADLPHAVISYFYQPDLINLQQFLDLN